MLDRRVETFLKLCETMSYRAAAEQLHITQPAVTQHIHALEQHYGLRTVPIRRAQFKPHTRRGAAGADVSCDAVSGEAFAR